jgi:hypothetical protein
MAKRMHCEERLRLEIATFPHKQLCEHWFNDRGYSTSCHLPFLRSLVIGMKARYVAEVGAGRSTIVLHEACREVGAKFYSCDRYDYKWLYPDLCVGNTSTFWSQFANDKFQVIFLDHLSSKVYSRHEASEEVHMAWECLDKPGVMVIHDAGNPKYAISHTGWAKNGTILPYGNTVLVLTKGRYNPETEAWPKKKDSTEIH